MSHRNYVDSDNHGRHENRQPINRLPLHNRVSSGCSYERCICGARANVSDRSSNGAVNFEVEVRVAAGAVIEATVEQQVAA